MLMRLWRKRGTGTRLTDVQNTLLPIWKTKRSFLRELKIGLLYNAAAPLLGIYLKKAKTLIRRHMCTPIFITVLFTQPSYGVNIWAVRIR